MPDDLKNAIRRRFISDVMRSAAKEIFNDQVQAYNRSGLVTRTTTAAQGGLLSTLQRAKNQISPLGISGQRLSLFSVAHMRSLDARSRTRKRKKSGYKIYNRVVYGLIYGRIYAKLMYGMTLDIVRALKSQIENAGK